MACIRYDHQSGLRLFDGAFFQVRGKTVLGYFSNQARQSKIRSSRHPGYHNSDWSDRVFPEYLAGQFAIQRPTGIAGDVDPSTANVGSPVQPAGALALGAIASILCYIAIIMKNRLGYDDSLDAFGVHGIGGIVGAIFLVFFMRGNHSAGEVVSQLGVQALAVGIAIVYAALGTLVLVFLIDKVIGLRTSEKSEMQGLDASYHGEHGYGMLNLG